MLCYVLVEKLLRIEGCQFVWQIIGGAPAKERL